MHFWDRVADVVDNAWGGASLKADVLRASSSSMGFLHLDFFHLVGRLPYSLTQGDYQANLDRLRAAPAGLDYDPLTLKIKFLLTTGCPRYEIIQALILLKELPCSTRLVEQNHACAAWIMKMHPLIEESVLRDRSLANQFVTLVRPSVHQKTLGKLEKKLQDLDKFKGQISGTHLFRRAFNQQQVDDPTFGSGRQRALNLMVASNVAWEALPKRQKTDFDRQARVEVHERFNELDKDREHLRHAQFIAERARKLELQSLVVISSSENCHFRHTDLIAITEAFNDLATGHRLLPDDS